MRIAPRRRAVLAPLLAAIAAGCSGDATNETPGAARPVAADTPRAGGELRLNFSGVTTLDPARASGLNESAVIRQIFDGLVELDEELRVVPEAATGFELSEDRRTFRFRLRPDARFHAGGRLVEAADFVYSFERLVDPRIDSPAASFLSVVAGVEEFRSGRAERVGGFAAPSRDLFEITLVEPYPPFLGLLAMQWAKVVPREAVEAGGFGAQPIGSGPFRFESWERGSRIVLAANETYSRGCPLLDRVIVSDLEGDAELDAFLGGKLDYLAVSESQVERLRRAGAYPLTRRPSLTLTYLGFDAERPGLDDERVRRAIACAIDRVAIERALEGQAIAAATILPPGMPGYDPSNVAESRGDGAARARVLLAEAGHENGAGLPPFRVLVGGVPNQAAVSEILRSHLARIGIAVRIEPAADFESYVAGLRGAEMYVFGWGADFPDPDNFLAPLFRTGAPYNFGGYSNPEVDRLLDAARHRADKVSRLGLYRQAERLILDDAPIVPLFHDSMVHSQKPEVRDLRVSPLGIFHASLRRVWKSTPPALEPPR